MFKKNYNKKELMPVILELVSKNKGITVSPSYCNESLVEFSEHDGDNVRTEITEIENDGTYLYVYFTQSIDIYYDEFNEGSIYKYETIQLLTDIEEILKK